MVFDIFDIPWVILGNSVYCSVSTSRSLWKIGKSQTHLFILIEKSDRAVLERFTRVIGLVRWFLTGFSPDFSEYDL